MAADRKHRGPSPTPVADDPVVQHRFAVVDGDLQGVRVFFIGAMGDVWATITSGGPCSLQQSARVMLASQVLQKSAVAAVDAMLQMEGASAADADNPIQRCSRDLHATGQHVFFSSPILIRGTSGAPDPPWRRSGSARWSA